MKALTDKQKKLAKYLKRNSYGWDKKTYERIVEEGLYANLDTAYSSMRSLARKGIIEEEKIEEVVYGIDTSGTHYTRFPEEVMFRSRI